MTNKKYKCKDFLCEHCYDDSCPIARDIIKDCRQCWYNLDDCELCDNWECGVHHSEDYEEWNNEEED